MDPLDFLEPSQLLQFFNCRKTEMSCMEKPLTFLRQLVDYKLIPEEKYEKVSRMKSKENIKSAVYDILVWIEKEQSEHIGTFWNCVFKDVILNSYPTLKMMHKSLLDGSFAFDSPLPKREKEEEKGKTKSSSLSVKRKTQENSRGKKRKTQSDDDENPGPLDKATPGQKKKPKKLSFSTPLKKGEKADIWTWPLYKSQLPVTCGNLKGYLDRARLAKGQKCILLDSEIKEWLTPNEFEKLAGKGSSKNWKSSIRCQGTTLKKLIEEGHLKYSIIKRKAKTKGSSNTSVPDSEGVESGLEELGDWSSSGEEENPTKETAAEETEPQGDRRFLVTCRALSGVLHQRRFASGTNGKSIRTETAWMTPIEFVRAANQTDGSWRRDIIHDGKPISSLLTGNILRIHSLLCTCHRCKPDREEQDNQKNDDECFICKSQDGKLVVCEECPRSFHPQCHLPKVEDSTLSDDQPWYCTFCIFRNLHACRYSDEEQPGSVTSLSVAQHMMECQYLLMHLISTGEEKISCLEKRPSFMPSPTWLSSVAEKLQTRQYKTVGQFVQHIHNILLTCASDNQNSEFSLRNQLKQLFDEEYTTVFSIPSTAAE